MEGWKEFYTIILETLLFLMIKEGGWCARHLVVSLIYNLKARKVFILIPKVFPNKHAVYW